MTVTGVEYAQGVSMDVGTGSTVNLTVNGPQEYIKCKGLAPDRYYRLERDNVQIVASGMAFMHAGIPIPREIPEFTAFIYHLTAID